MKPERDKDIISAYVDSEIHEAIKLKAIELDRSRSWIAGKILEAGIKKNWPVEEVNK